MNDLEAAADILEECGHPEMAERVRKRAHEVEAYEMMMGRDRKYLKISFSGGGDDGPYQITVNRLDYVQVVRVVEAIEGVLPSIRGRMER